MILSGHSQGSLLSTYIATVRHRLGGVASLGGGSPVFAPEALTSPVLHRAFHHVDDADAARRAAYGVLGVPEENIRAIDWASAGCEKNPHSCVIIDELIPLIDGEAGSEPAFLAEWRWLVEARAGAPWSWPAPADDTTVSGAPDVPDAGAEGGCSLSSDDTSDRLSIAPMLLALVAAVRCRRRS